MPSEHFPCYYHGWDMLYFDDMVMMMNK